MLQQRIHRISNRKAPSPLSSDIHLHPLVLDIECVRFLNARSQLTLPVQHILVSIINFFSGIQYILLVNTYLYQ